MTNFHLPKSSLLMLVAAFAGRERVLAAYREAVEQRYRFYSYGDAMLIKCRRASERRVAWRYSVLPVKFTYEEFDLSGVRTYPLASRQSKANAEDFARPLRAGARR